MFPSIFDIQPRRVSYQITLIGVISGERRIEVQLPWENDIVPSFDDRQGLDTVSGCNHLSGNSIGGRPTFGDSTLQFGAVGEACSEISSEIIS